MVFSRIEPESPLSRFIDCYWVIESSDPTPRREKIIPDGFSEIILHHSKADPYRINLSGRWEMQTKSLLGGQISKYFYLENSGQSGMVGIKCKPTALTHLFNLTMTDYTDRVVDLYETGNNSLIEFAEYVQTIEHTETKLEALNRFFGGLINDTDPTESPVDVAVNMIFAKHGTVSVKELVTAAMISERQLERLFQKYIGLSPKFFTRIIRFNYIFQLMQQGDPTWADLSYQSGFYDQSHFIRNFKTFTGEDPSSYLYDEKNMANFFLRKGL